MKYNGTPVFDMLAVRATPRGFEIEFTEPMSAENEISAAGFFVQQWKYLSTPNYGGPKLDLQKVRITEVTLSPDRKKVNLQMAGLKKEYVVYFRLPEGLKNEKGQSLWSSEAWYTLNNIPD
jgi:cytochrome c